MDVRAGGTALVLGLNARPGGELPDRGYEALLVLADLTVVSMPSFPVVSS